MNQITTRYITENGACYEQYVITDPEAKTALTITPERGGMITSFTLDGEEFVWTRRPNFSECNRPRFGVPVLFPSCGNPDNGVHIFDGKAYPMETHGYALPSKMWTPLSGLPQLGNSTGTPKRGRLHSEKLG